MFDMAAFDVSAFDASGTAENPRKFDDVVVPSWFSTAINQEKGSNIYKLMQIIMLRASEIAKMHADIIACRSISTATGAALDALADGYGIAREQGESDEAFRVRIPTAIMMYASSGSVPEIKEAVAFLLGMQASEITVLERYATSPYAIFTVRLCGRPAKVYDWADVDAVISKIKPAGVRYESAEYNITPEWVAGVTGFGFDPWGEQYPSE